MTEAEKSREEGIIKKLRTLSPEKLDEVEDFVDFIRLRGDDRRLVRAAGKLSEETLKKVWDNEDDAIYDRP